MEGGKLPPFDLGSGKTARPTPARPQPAPAADPDEPPAPAAETPSEPPVPETPEETEN